MRGRGRERERERKKSKMLARSMTLCFAKSAVQFRVRTPKSASVFTSAQPCPGNWVPAWSIDFPENLKREGKREKKATKSRSFPSFSLSRLQCRDREGKEEIKKWQPDSVSQRNFCACTFRFHHSVNLARLFLLSCSLRARSKLVPARAWKRRYVLQPFAVQCTVPSWISVVPCLVTSTLVDVCPYSLCTPVQPC